MDASPYLQSAMAELQSNLSYLIHDLFKRSDKVYWHYWNFINKLSNYKIANEVLKLFIDDHKFPSKNEFMASYNRRMAEQSKFGSICKKCGGSKCLIFLLNGVETAYACEDCMGFNTGIKTIRDANRANLQKPDLQIQAENYFRMKGVN